MIDAVIIGAGPAGLSAAISCRKWGLEVVVIDEFMKPGGRLRGQLHQEPNGQWWNGLEETNSLLTKIEELHIKVECGVSVHHIEKLETGFIVHTNKTQIVAKNLLIATGAAETAAPIPGWTLPGVMTIGAAQVMTNVHRVRVGNKGVVVGVNLLSIAIARELQLAGITLSSIALPAKNASTNAAGSPRLVLDALLRIAHLAPSAFIRYGSKLAIFSWLRKLIVQYYPKNGVRMWGIPIQIRKAIVQINGTEQVESVTMCDITADGERIRGSEYVLEADFVCIAGGLYPLAELAAIAGCPFRYLEELGGYVPIHNERMETTLADLFVAGNITGIENAKVASAQGTLAGLSIVKHIRKDDVEVEKSVLAAMEDVKEIRRKSTIKFHPNIDIGREKIEAAFHEYIKSQ
jgi:sarcosine oxidase subunit alpha